MATSAKPRPTRKTTPTPQTPRRVEFESHKVKIWEGDTYREFTFDEPLTEDQKRAAQRVVLFHPKVKASTRRAVKAAVQSLRDE